MGFFIHILAPHLKQIVRVYSIVHVIDALFSKYVWLKIDLMHLSGRKGKGSAFYTAMQSQISIV